MGRTRQAEAQRLAREIRFMQEQSAPAVSPAPSPPSPFPLLAPSVYGEPSTQLSGASHSAEK